MISNSLGLFLWSRSSLLFTMTIIMSLLYFCLRSIFMKGMRVYFKTTSKIVLTLLFLTKKLRGTWSSITYRNIPCPKPIDLFTFFFFFNFWHEQVTENPSTPLKRSKVISFLKTNEDIAPQSCEILQTFVWWGAQTCPPPHIRL